MKRVLLFALLWLPSAVLAQDGTTHSTFVCWNPVTTGSDGSAVVVIGYNVYRSQLQAGPFAQINPVVVASLLTVDANGNIIPLPDDKGVPLPVCYEDGNIAQGSTYFYVVTAINEGGESQPSSPLAVSVPMINPNPPPQVSADVT
jgi:hypothetical protein